MPRMDLIRSEVQRLLRTLRLSCNRFAITLSENSAYRCYHRASVRKSHLILGKRNGVSLGLASRAS